MKILVATDFYEPFIGGAERQVQLLALALANRGHDVRVATVWHEGLSEHVRDDGFEVHRLRSRLLEQRSISTDPVRRFHPPFPVAGIVGGLRRLIAEQQTEVVHANGWIAYSCAAAVLGSKVPLVLSVRDYGYSCAVRTLMHLDRAMCSGPSPAKCLQCANHRYGAAKALAAVSGVSLGRPLLVHSVRGIHAVSTFIRDNVRRDLVGSTESGWSPPIIRIPDIPPMPSERPSEGAAPSVLPSEPFILFVGQLTRLKGVAWLLEAYGALNSPPPLVLIGTRWPDTPKVMPAGVVMIDRQADHVPYLRRRASAAGNTTCRRW